MTQPIYFDSLETGAPTLNNAAGSQLEVLRACLINGFNPRSVTSIVVASGVATATSATHGYGDTYGKLVLVEGAPAAGLNGRKQPLSVSTNTFTYAAPGVSDGTYTGVITAKRAPLGWIEAFTGTNKAIFERTDPAATDWGLRVLDTGSSPASSVDARWMIVGGATDVDTYTLQAPIASALGGAGAYVPKGTNNTTAKRWALIGDELSFWFFCDFSAGAARLAPHFFGDAVPLYAIDPGRAVLLAADSAQSGFANTKAGEINSMTGGDGHAGSVCALGIDGVTAGRITRITGIGNNQQAIGSNHWPVAGSDVGINAPIWFFESQSPQALRGSVPGLAQPLAFEPFTHFSVVADSSGSGRSFLAITHSCYGRNGQMLIDLTGPWQ